MVVVDDERFLRVLHVQTRVDDTHVALITTGVEVPVVGGENNAFSYRSKEDEK